MVAQSHVESHAMLWRVWHPARLRRELHDPPQHLVEAPFDAAPEEPWESFEGDKDLARNCSRALVLFERRATDMLSGGGGAGELKQAALAFHTAVTSCTRARYASAQACASTNRHPASSTSRAPARMWKWWENGGSPALRAAAPGRGCHIQLATAFMIAVCPGLLTACVRL